VIKSSPNTKGQRRVTECCNMAQGGYGCNCAKQDRLTELEKENEKLRDALGMLIKHVKEARSPDVKVRMKDFREAMDNAEAALRPERKK
jgi:hypothetical protein